MFQGLLPGLLKLLQKPFTKIIANVLTPLVIFVIAKIALVAPDAAGTIDAAAVTVTLSSIVFGFLEWLTNQLNKTNTKEIQRTINEALPAHDQLKVDGKIGEETLSKAKTILIPAANPKSKVQRRI